MLVLCCDAVRGGGAEREQWSPLHWSPGLCGLLRSLLFLRFICAGMWGHRVLPAALPAPFSVTLSPALSVYLCANVAPKGLLVVRLPALFVPHSASLGPPGPRMSSPTRCQSPPLLSVWMYVSFFIYFVLDFLAV